MIKKSNISFLPVILNGGQASRYGGKDKALIHINGQNALQHITQILGPQTHISVHRHYDGNRYHGHSIIRDIDIDGGPTIGVISALIKAKQRGDDFIITSPCDTPILPQDYVERLMNAAQDTPLYVHYEDRDHYLHAIWPVKVLDQLDSVLTSTDFQAKRSMRVLHEIMGAKSLEFKDLSSPVFFNVNSIGDKKRLEALLKDNRL